MKRISFVLSLFLILPCLAGCGRMSDEPCDWCGKSPSVAYATASEYGDAHVCKECSSTCMLCGNKKATKHYENLLGGVVFVCNDCYDEVSSYSD